MVNIRNVSIALMSTAVLSLCACSAAPAGESIGSNGQAVIADAVSMVQRSDGNFNVTCKNGTSEVDTPAQIEANEVCVTHASSTTDPFDPASCTGSALTFAQAITYVNPPSNLDVKVGTFQVYRRWRQIFTNFPAGPWQTSGVSDVVNSYEIEDGSFSGYFDADSTGGLAQVALSGEVHVDYDNNMPLLTLYGTSASFASTNSVQFLINDWNYTSTTIPQPDYYTSQAQQEYYASEGWYSENYLPLTFGGNTLTFQTGIATESCVRLAFDGTQNESDNDGNTWVEESQLVVLGTIGR